MSNKQKREITFKLLRPEHHPESSMIKVLLIGNKKMCKDFEKITNDFLKTCTYKKINGEKAKCQTKDG